MIRDILQVPDDRLRQVCAKIETPLSKEMRALSNDLLDTMRKHRGSGLAAPQVGELVRMITVNPRSGCPFSVLVNPEIIDASGARPDEEGCLSVNFGKDRYVKKRAERIRVRFVDRADQEHILVLEGYAARVVQHEVDHLDGKLIGP